MFQNSYQGNIFFEFFDAKNSKQKDKTIYKLSNPNIVRTFDKDMKNYILELDASSTQMIFPKEEKQQLYLIQQFLVFQILITGNSNFNLELVISDITKTKRRLIFSQAQSKIQKKPFFTKFSNEAFSRGRWLNLCIDLWSFMNCFKGQTFRSLDKIYLTGGFKLRKIFTTRQLMQTDLDYQSTSQKSQSLLPKNFNYPTGIEYQNLHFDYDQYFPQQATISKNTDISTNVSTQIKMKETKTKQFSTPKVLPLKSSNKTNDGYDKHFLASTNIPQAYKMKKEMEKQMQAHLIQNKQIPKNKYQKEQKEQNNQQQIEVNYKPKNNIQLTKTNPNTSFDKKTRSPEKKKHQVKKINPWRGNTREKQTKSIQKSDGIQTAETTLFKNKAYLEKKVEDLKQNTNNKKIQNYSDSEYFEKSQKFSTITDPKFFQQISHLQNSIENLNESQQKKIGFQQQIQEAIQMETNSMCSSIKKQHIQQLIQEHPKPQILNTSFYSKQDFMNKQLKKLIGEIQRPYTPPINSYIQINEQKKITGQSKEVQLIYDAVLNCYYDFKTNTYYELKA